MKQIKSYLIKNPNIIPRKYITNNLPIHIIHLLNRFKGIEWTNSWWCIADKCLQVNF